MAVVNYVFKKLFYKMDFAAVSLLIESDCVTPRSNQNYVISVPLVEQFDSLVASIEGVKRIVISAAILSLISRDRDEVNRLCGAVSDAEYTDLWNELFEKEKARWAHVMECVEAQKAASPTRMRQPRKGRLKNEPPSAA